jgi:hypothetical protein
MIARAPAMVVVSCAALTGKVGVKGGKPGKLDLAFKG